jgi:hypothetical protein
MQDFEKLGSFYLGRTYDLERRTRRDELVLYDAKDLTTHAVCVGMTGSGKTGLCLALLEEAAIDGIPALVVDPKGDLANLLLTFPALRAQDFEPWVDPEEARRKGLTPAEHAAAQANAWSAGLAEWGQDGARIQRLRDAADFAVYTPGSNAGIPVSVLRSFDAPDAGVAGDEELLRERIATMATSLLGLLSIDADPISSREHILLSNILAKAWGDGQGLDLAQLIQAIQSPPVARIGVLDLESFFPAKERFAFAMRVNNLLAAPGFATWLEGDPLDVDRLLHTQSGKPRVAILSIAHLSDAERMFFVALLLNQTLAWVRRQSGTSSLRAILYMDEIAGYFPPVANPPSKAPLLTLMKQARAFGLGVVLATQNPVDLDYKGLANAGTWFIGRLQTERDKLRVLDGLEGAAAHASSGFDRASVDRAISELGPRVFLMNNVHEDAPVIFQTRWVLSYLRGPLTRAEIKRLMDARRTEESAPAKAAARSEAAAPGAAAPVQAAGASSDAARPVLPPEIPSYFLPLRGAARAGDTLVYRPMLLGFAKVLFSDKKAGSVEESVALLCPMNTGPVAVDWDTATVVEIADTDLEAEPHAGASFGALPPDAAKAKSYDAWRKAFADALFRGQELELLRSSVVGELSRPRETERDFRMRLAQRAREMRDELAAKLRQKYAPKLATLDDRIRRAEQTIAVQKEQASQAKVGTMVSIGSTLLSAFLGRKAFSSANVGRAATAVRGAGRSMKEASDVGRAEESAEAVRQQKAALEAEFQREVDALGARFDPLGEELERLALRPQKTGISVRAVVLAWAPHWRAADGTLRSAWT